MKSSASKKVKPTANNKSTIKPGSSNLIVYPFPCPNCDHPINEAKLYCSEICKQEAKFVRYVRDCRRDGRDQQPDVQEAIQIKLAMILGGGYPEQERRLSKTIRDAVIKRDGGCCKKCGKPGTDIDHIHGNSNKMKNLQTLCRACHNQKTKASFVPISPESDPEAWAKTEALNRRIESAAPQKLCDAEEWAVIWRDIFSKRRQAIQTQARNGLKIDSGPPNPVLVYAEVAGFYDPEDPGDMSDGEQAEYFALLDGGGDEAWAIDMFGIDPQDYNQWQKGRHPKPTRKPSSASEHASKRSQDSPSAKKGRK